MKKIFINHNELFKFLDKEGIEAYNSLIKSNNIISDGVIFGFNIPYDKEKIKEALTDIRIAENRLKEMKSGKVKVITQTKEEFLKDLKEW